jgi:sucrose-6-phosphate hydrolase SacC (GH32 family)
MPPTLLVPQFHYTPYQGWINDPAGLIQWNGRHHLFSQFNPAPPEWGPMHWSHADSPDAADWSNFPVALYPPYSSNPLDSSGRFTSSAIKDSSGELRLIFTDFTDFTDVTFHPNAIPEVVSTAASTDGVTFPLHAGNPIVAAPPADSTSCFRDPKAFWDPIDSSWKMVCGNARIYFRWVGNGCCSIAVMS